MEIAPLSAAHLGDAAHALAAAFCSNPGFRAAVPDLDDATRERRLRPLFRSFTRTCLRHGAANVVLDGARVAGAALDYGPGSYPLALVPWLLNSSGALLLGPAAMLRLLRIDAWMRQGHPAAPHWYLFMLGVAPRDHGRGFGGALLRRLSERADGDGVSIYLETDRPENVPLYERFGYQVTEEAQLPGFASLTMWRMVRPVSAR